MQPEPFFALKDWIYLVGLALTAGTFAWKLQADSRFARYRETINFIEKREKEMRERWDRIKHSKVAGFELEEEVRVFTGQLELVLLLMRLEAFDEEIVYNLWWGYFDEPLHNSHINSWIILAREGDAAVLEHYVRRCAKWAPRLDQETGNAGLMPWWRRRWH